MTPAGFLMPLWPEVHAAEPDLELQMVPFENTRENARQILANLGDTIDVVPGIFDERLLELRRCSATELTRVTFCVAVSLTHPLAQKTRLTVADLAGEHLYLMRPGWSSSIRPSRAWSKVPNGGKCRIWRPETPSGLAGFQAPGHRAQSSARRPSSKRRRRPQRSSGFSSYLARIIYFIQK